MVSEDVTHPDRVQSTAPPVISTSVVRLWKILLASTWEHL